MGREVENKGNRMNEIDLLVKLFKAVKLMRSLQQSPCLASERKRAEKRVDFAIASRLSRMSEDRQLQFTLGGKNG